VPVVENSEMQVVNNHSALASIDAEISLDDSEAE
jgi:hypothetical protein